MTKEPITSSRIRSIRECTFGWIDHNLLHQGYVKSLSRESLLLYFFLCLVADRNGCSYYDYEKVCLYLKFSLEQFMDARDQLIDQSLIVFKDSVYQVLRLPERNKSPVLPQKHDHQAGFQELKQVFDYVKEH